MIRIRTLGETEPDNSFRNPLGLMSDCHRRIEMFLDRLLHIARMERGSRLDPELRETFDKALKYFEKGAPLHTGDEELSLFPRMRAVGSEEADAALSAIAALEADHREADAAHAEIDRLGRQWLNEGSLPEAEAARLVDLLAGLRETYRQHIDVEDNHVFPLAGRVLEASALEEVGREMATRRGLDFDHLPAGSRCPSERMKLR